MATHSSVLACRIPGTGEPGGLPSLGSHRVGHDRSDLAAEAAATSSFGKKSGVRLQLLLIPYPQPQATTHLVSIISADLPFLDISYE